MDEYLTLDLIVPLTDRRGRRLSASRFAGSCPETSGGVLQPGHVLGSPAVAAAFAFQDRPSGWRRRRSFARLR